MPDELEREIEEILSKIDKFPKESAFGRLRRRSVNRFRRWRRHLAPRLPRVSLGHVMAAALLLIILAYAFRSSAFGRYAFAVGLVLLFSAIAVSFFTARRPKQKQGKRWRGQVVDLSGPSLADRVRGWLSGRRRGGRW
jgi:hypothetical protein